jgi:hypothetical protein
MLAGWAADATSLISQNYDFGVSNSFHMYTGNYPNSINFGSSNKQSWSLGIGEHFGVTTEGAVYASAGRIGGIDIIDGKFQFGSDLMVIEGNMLYDALHFSNASEWLLVQGDLKPIKSWTVTSKLVGTDI